MNFSDASVWWIPLGNISPSSHVALIITLMAVSPAAAHAHFTGSFIRSRMSGRTNINGPERMSRIGTRDLITFTTSGVTQAWIRRLHRDERETQLEPEINEVVLFFRNLNGRGRQTPDFDTRDWALPSTFLWPVILLTSLHVLFWGIFRQFWEQSVSSDLFEIFLLR